MVFSRRFFATPVSRFYDDHQVTEPSYASGSGQACHFELHDIMRAHFDVGKHCPWSPRVLYTGVVTDWSLQHDGVVSIGVSVERRAKLRAIVFAESDKRKWLQNLLHPLISDYLRAQIAASTSPYCLLVNPLLLESGQGHWCDEILVVDVPETVQVARTMARDDNSRSQVESIMAAQMARSARLQHASKIITNDKDLTHLHDQIDTLHKDLLQP